VSMVTSRLPSAWSPTQGEKRAPALCRPSARSVGVAKT